MMDIEHFKTWHKIVATHLEFIADGIETVQMDAATVRDDGQCMLGQWLRERAGSHERQPEFRELQQRHREFHAVAAAIVEARAAGSREIPTARIRDASASMLRALDDFAATCRPIAGSNFRQQPSSPVWNDSLRVGVPAIDQQHQAIAELLQVLLADPAALASSEAVNDKLGELGRIATLHFDTEEMLLKRLGVEEKALAAHIEEHTRILEGIAQLHLDIMAGKHLTIDRIVTQLRSWIVVHILLFDQPEISGKAHASLRKGRETAA